MNDGLLSSLPITWMRRRAPQIQLQVDFTTGKIAK
jgi:hypothetical protein